MSENSLTYEPWVNTPGFVYRASKEETAELAQAQEDLTQEIPLVSGNPDATRVMRRRDYHALREKPSVARGTSVLWVLGALSVTLLVVALVWLAASWIIYFVEF
jgi:hypothetical protein